MELLTLSNGVQMPALGIGTFLMTPDQAEEAACQALTQGPSHRLQPEKDDAFSQFLGQAGLFVV